MTAEEFKVLLKDPDMQMFMEIVADKAADRALIKSGKPGKDQKYTIAQIVEKYPALKVRTVTDWCNKGFIGKKSRNGGKWYLTVPEVENFIYGKTTSINSK